MQYIVLGNYRGGTTLIAKLLINAGVYMGSNYGYNLEDKEFQMKDLKTIKEKIQERDVKYNIWGWKFPGTYNYIEKLLPYLKNPRFIFIFRDPLAVARTEYRTGNGFDRNFKKANKVNQRLIELYYKLNPKIAFSYENFWKKPDETIKQFTDFVGGDGEKLKKCITQTYENNTSSNK